jgi:hypothetical protein
MRESGARAAGPRENSRRGRRGTHGREQRKPGLEEEDED